MKVVYGGRASGKTIMLIREAADTDARIVCASMQQVEFIKKQAGLMHLSIQEPWPITRSPRGLHSLFHFDDIERLFQYLGFHELGIMTTSVPVEKIVEGVCRS